MRTHVLLASAVMLLLLVPSCESPPDAPIGALRLVTHTTGGDLDLDGYTATVDDVPVSVPVNGAVVVPDLATGSHEVTLDGIAENCQAFDATLSGIVQSRDTGDVEFTLACVATGIRVTVVTTGPDIDPDGYALTVDGASFPVIGTNEIRDVTRLTAGQHVINLAGLSANCSVSGDNPRSVAVVALTVAAVTIDVHCVATSGVVEVHAATTGVELDPNGYQVRLDGGAPLTLGLNGTVRFSGIAEGSHSVSITDLSSNCTVAADNPRTVTVAIGGSVRDTARTSFAVSCVTTRGSIRLEATTTGSELDPDGYMIVLDYYDWNGTLPINGQVTIPDVSAGQHVVYIYDVEPNCSVVGGNSRPADVTAGATTVVTFEFTCVQTGSVVATVATTGVDLDPNGYWLQFPNLPIRTIAANGSVTFEHVVPGDYQISLSDITLNCTLAGTNTRTVTVVSGAATPVAFDLTCATARQLGFVSTADGNEEIYLVKANGAGLTRLTMTTAADVEPAWSPDGSKLAFTSYRDGNGEIYVMNADGSNQVRLTSNPAIDAHPTWSPDGSKIVFASDRSGHGHLYVMNTDGSNPTQLTSDGATQTVESDPVWSSTGAIAFARSEPGASKIWVMDGNGGNAHAVTTSVSNAQPAWSPNGTQLVYRHNEGCDYSTCTDFLSVINADGSGDRMLTPQTNEPPNDPDWSPDGEWIAFGAGQCDYYNYYYYYFYCYGTGLGAVHPDGSGRVPILYGSMHSPAWRP